MGGSGGLTAGEAAAIAEGFFKAYTALAIAIIVVPILLICCCIYCCCCRKKAEPQVIVQQAAPAAPQNPQANLMAMHAQ